MLNAVKQSEENYAREQDQARVRDKQLRSARQTNRLDFNYLTLANSTPIRNDNGRSDQPGVHFNTNPVRHVYSTMHNRDDQYEPSINDSIIQGAGSAPADQFATNTTSATGRNNLWRCNNGTNTATNTTPHRTSTRPTSRNGLHNNNSPNPSDTRNGPTCFRYREQGHMRSECRERVFCNNCKTYNHNTCRKQHNNIPSPANSQITTGYHPTATPPPLMGTTTATQQAHQTGTHNSPLFQNLLENNQPRTSTMIHTPYNGATPEAPADIVEGLAQIMTQVANNNKRDDASKQMMKNIKIFDGSNKAKYITWLSQVEAAARFTKNTIPWTNLPEHGTHYVTCIFRIISTCVWRRHQGCDLNQLLRYSKHHRSSYMTTEHANCNQKTSYHIQPQIWSNPQGSIQTVAQTTRQQNCDSRIRQETTNKHQR